MNSMPPGPSGAERTTVPASSRPDDHGADRIILRSEFATVAVWLRDPGGRPRLHIEDLRTNQGVELDALELESLAWARHADLTPLLDPSATRWIGTGD
ncbi:hypothetical protein [Rhodococcus sp. LB1]|uniref:hypothetical protein n=1 Tax=Rhodococcus sp. LB1 TaxID=1807499 RepID=UPI000A7A75D1|nr:hypothetical protein [Rhodococcus sp. LB1]